ncbi:4-hydroxy-2-oxoglutarate aldolase, mitochondrial-like [Babylonia areolata]|uniref:4-hydroxy-2-oxoglutarate aldolase, mitochondrial-like n=1 Tax=Babylonia areolata TaxID=304850 RepID=UPI003FD5C84B
MAVRQVLKRSAPHLFRWMSGKGARVPLDSLHFHSGVRAASTLDISGIYPPVTTPFRADETIAYDKLQSNIDKWNKIPFRGYVVQGSNGEYAFLTSEERVEMVKRVKEMVPAGKLLIAGSGCESTSATIAMTEKMAEAGVDAVMVVTPCYYKANMTGDAMLAHYTKVADSSPVPVILYNVPVNTGLDLAPEVIVKLASHPNIIGLKESGGDVSKMGNLAHRTKGEDFQLLAGSAGYLLPAYSVGCVGGVCALADALGEEVCRLAELYSAGNLKEAQSLQQRLVAPNAAVTRQLGVAGLKAVMDDLGYYGGPTRLPMLPLTQSQRDSLRQVFQASGFM